MTEEATYWDDEKVSALAERFRALGFMSGFNGLNEGSPIFKSDNSDKVYPMVREALNSLRQKKMTDLEIDSMLVELLNAHLEHRPLSSVQQVRYDSARDFGKSHNDARAYALTF